MMLLTGIQPPQMLMIRPLHVSPAQFATRFSRVLIEASFLAISGAVARVKKAVMQEFRDEPA